MGRITLPSAEIMAINREKAEDVLKDDFGRIRYQGNYTYAS